MKTSRGFAPIIFVIIIGLAVLGGGTYWVIQSSTGIISVVPSSGQAPLAVTFSVAAIDSFWNSGVYYTIYFGYDDEAGGFPRTPNPTISHIYKSAGVYTAVVTRMTKCGSWECLGPSSDVGTVKVTVQ